MIYLKNMVSGQTVQIPRNEILDYQPINPKYVNNQTKNVEITANTSTTITYDSGYTGLEKVRLTVDVDTTSVWNEGFSSGYSSGYTDGLEGGSVEAFEEGFASGLTSGITYQKGLLSSIEISANTAITRSDGYSAITVNVPTGITGTEIPLTSTTYSADSYGVYWFKYDPTDQISSITINFIRSYENEYLTFRAHNELTLVINCYSGLTINDFKYSLDGGETWSDVVGYNTDNGWEMYLDSGETVMFKGLTNAICTGIVSTETLGLRFNTIDENSTPAELEVFGNPMSLLYGDNFRNQQTVGDLALAGLFYECTGLTDASNMVLPATTLGENCYYRLFRECKRLTGVPTLPATTLAKWCYAQMFEDCESLTTAPELPATNLVQGCYWDMFFSCISLTKAPDLPATTLVQSCYSDMFWGCTSLNYIKCLATSGINQSSSTYNWVSGVSATGTFVKDENANWPSGLSGIPNGWVVEDYGVDWSERYLTFVSRANNNTFTLTIPSANTSSNLTSVSYSTDNGTTWHTYSPNGTDQTITVSGISKNEKVIWKGIANAYSPDGVTGNRCHFSSTGSYEAKGNIMSLLYGDNFTGQTSLTASYTFFRMFDGVANLVSIDHLILPATNITTYCYQSMFQNCSGLTTIERFQLPATALQERCYNAMFADCANLESGCTLPAPTLVKDCYRAMFIRTPKLRYIKCLATAGINQNTSTYSWLGNDASGTKTFVKSPDAQVSESSSGSGNTWPRSVDGIPSGWSVVDNS